MKTSLYPLLAILAVTVANSQPVDSTHALYRQADIKMNDVYQMLLAAKRTDSLFIKNLRVAQRAWIQFRNAEFTLKYPTHASIDSLDLLSDNEAMYLTQLTQGRTIRLVEWLKIATSGLIGNQFLLHGPRALSGGSNGPREVYVSDMKIIASDHVHGGVGLDKPYWGGKLIIRQTTYDKGILIHPEEGGVAAFVEFLLPREGGRLEGVAGYCEETGTVYRGRMRFRILADGDLLLAEELRGPQSHVLNIPLGHARVLRIETDDGGDGNNADHMAFGDLKVVY